MSGIGATIAEQAFGFIGLGLIMASWQFDSRRSILLLNVSAFLAFALGLFILDAVVGAVMMLFAALIAVTAVFTRKRLLMILLVAGPVLLGLTQAERPHDYLPIAAHITGAVAFFSERVVTMRAWAPLGTVLWAIYNVIVGAWGQFIADLFILSSMAIGAYRHRGD